MVISYMLIWTLFSLSLELKVPGEEPVGCGTLLTEPAVCNLPIQ